MKGLALPALLVRLADGIDRRRTSIGAGAWWDLGVAAALGYDVAA
jgi:hypothetical protein